MRNGERRGEAGDGDGDIAGKGRRGSRIGDAAQLQLGWRGIVHADDPAFGRRRVKVIHALRRVRAGRDRWPAAVGAGDQSAKGGDDNRTAGEQGAFPHDKRGGVHERSGRAENIHADVKRVGVNAERRIIGKSTRVARRRNEVVLELEKSPHGAAGDDARIADGEEDAVGQCPRRARHINDEDEPFAGEPVVADARVAGEIIVCGRGHHGVKKRIHARVQNAVGLAGGFVERTQAAIHRHDELRGADRAHGVRRIRIAIRQRGGGETKRGVGAERTRLVGERPVNNSRVRPALGQENWKLHCVIAQRDVGIPRHVWPTAGVTVADNEVALMWLGIVKPGSRHEIRVCLENARHAHKWHAGYRTCLRRNS